MIGAVASGARFSFISVRCQSVVAAFPEAARRFSQSMEPADHAMKLTSGTSAMIALPMKSPVRVPHRVILQLR